MINLLPPDTKQAYKYARRNRMLVRWIISAAFCLAGGALLLGGGYLYLNQSINTTTQQIADSNSQLKSQNLAGVQKQVTTISNNLKLVVQVLSKEILFSKLLKQLASVTPSDVILTNLVITQAQGGVEITAQTANYNAATQLQVNLADPKNQIFTEADIVSINCLNSGTTGNSQYPCTADIRALFATDNPFLFTNNGSSP
ncbi:MAG: PilN domain-containing protein [Candidatus Saccharibacteria bacterium]